MGIFEMASLAREMSERAKELMLRFLKEKTLYTKCPNCGAVVKGAMLQVGATGECDTCGIEFIAPVLWREKKGGGVRSGKDGGK